MSTAPVKPSSPSGPAPGPTFRDLGLGDALVQALADVGYEAPSPIQALTIPPLLEGRDVLGQAQTGTGKTAAFALPVLARLNLKQSVPQALVLAPTRELAIQVAEAFQRYAAHLPGFHVLPIYGGQSYGPQLSALRRGVHVVVGTPGRVIDHMERGTLNLDALKFLVLDEADEMLRMGFIEDVEKVLKKVPPTRQVALFSATMPSTIRRIAQTYLKNPAELTVRNTTTTVANTRQRYWIASHGVSKLEALTRILEAEPFEGMLIFARTKQGTVELSTRLEARGLACAPLNGDIDQRTRERTVGRLKSGNLDIIVATDVAARGLDVERISHVINFDMPTDSETYVHRIGRTGRAGRKGEAILFVTPRERHMLKVIERATRQSLTAMELPSADAVLASRLGKLTDSISGTLATPRLGATLDALRTALSQMEKEQNIPAIDIAAALAYLVQGDTAVSKAPTRAKGAEAPPFGGSKNKGEPRAKAQFEAAQPERERKPKRQKGMETYRVEVGLKHKVKPGNIVGALANEAEIDAVNIGRVQIFDDYSLVDLPEGMPKAVFKHLRKVWVSGQQLQISRAGAKGRR